MMGVALAELLVVGHFCAAFQTRRVRLLHLGGRMREQVNRKTAVHGPNRHKAELLHVQIIPYQRANTRLRKFLTGRRMCKFLQFFR